VFLWVGGLGYWFDTDDRSYVRHRMLRKDLGSWMQLDPLWPEHQSYSYVSGRQVSIADPSGLGDDSGTKQLCKITCRTLICGGLPPVLKQACIAGCYKSCDSGEIPNPGPGYKRYRKMSSFEECLSCCATLCRALYPNPGQARNICISTCERQCNLAVIAGEYPQDGETSK
jgi:hypothetical protein